MAEKAKRWLKKAEAPHSLTGVREAEFYNQIADLSKICKGRRWQ